jgi:hypothetical protein
LKHPKNLNIYCRVQTRLTFYNFHPQEHGSEKSLSTYFSPSTLWHLPFHTGDVPKTLSQNPTLPFPLPATNLCMDAPLAKQIITLYFTGLMEKSINCRLDNALG